MYESPQGRIHQASLRLRNNNIVNYEPIQVNEPDIQGNRSQIQVNEPPIEGNEIQQFSIHQTPRRRRQLRIDSPRYHDTDRTQSEQRQFEVNDTVEVVVQDDDIRSQDTVQPPRQEIEEEIEIQRGVDDDRENDQQIEIQIGFEEDNEIEEQNEQQIEQNGQSSGIQRQQIEIEQHNENNNGKNRDGLLFSVNMSNNQNINNHTIVDSNPLSNPQNINLSQNQTSQHPYNNTQTIFNNNHQNKSNQNNQNQSNQNNQNYNNNQTNNNNLNSNQINNNQNSNVSKIFMNRRQRIQIRVLPPITTKILKNDTNHMNDQNQHQQNHNNPHQSLLFNQLQIRDNITNSNQMPSQNIHLVSTQPQIRQHQIVTQQNTPLNYRNTFYSQSPHHKQQNNCNINPKNLQINTQIPQNSNPQQTIQLINAQSPKQKEQNQSMKNQEVSKNNVHKSNNKKKQKQKQKAKSFSYKNGDQMPKWFGEVIPLFSRPFQFSPETKQKFFLENIKCIQINTRNLYFQQKFRTPIALLGYKMSDIYMSLLNNLSFVNQHLDKKLLISSENVLQNLIKKNKQKQDKQTVKISPFDRLKIRYVLSNSQEENQQNVSMLDPQLKDEYQQMLQPQTKNSSSSYFLNLITLRKQREDEIMRQIQFLDHKAQIISKDKNDGKKRYYQQIYNSKGPTYKLREEDLSQTKNKSISTNDKTTTSKKSSHFGKYPFGQKMPKVSEFSISPYDKPYTKKYNVTVHNYECSPIKWIWKKYQTGLKTNYNGEVKFEQYSSQINVNDVIIRDILKKQKLLKDLFKDQRKIIQQYGLKKWQSSSFDMQLKGVLNLPLKLKLPQGYDYFYSYYFGDTISDLVIYNKFAQVSFVQDIKIEEKSEKARDLRNKIRFDNDGIWIGCQILKKKCKFMLFGTEQKLEVNELTDQKIIESKIVLNKDGKANEVYYDTMVPARVYGEIEWKKQKTKISYEYKLWLLLFSLMIFLIGVCL